MAYEEARYRFEKKLEDENTIGMLRYLIFFSTCPTVRP